MFKRANGLMRFPFRLLPIVVFGILLTATMNIIIASVNYSDLRIQSEETTLLHEEDVWSEIEDSILTKYTENRLLTGQLALKIENGIIREYSDISVLKNELDNNDLGSRFHKVVHGIIEQSDLRPSGNPYLTLVGTRENLILSATNTEDNIMKFIDTKTLLSWSSVAELTPNKIMSSKALDLVFEKNQGIIFTQTNDNYSIDSLNGSINLDTLKEIYESEGLRGLYDFSILTPGFVTESGDIFGTEDRYYLSKTNNHKLIVVQIISLESLLKDQGNEIALLIENNNMEEKSIERYMLQNLITTVTITLMLFIISLVLIGVHNAETDRNRKVNDADS